MGCNCGDNEYNITVNNNGNCEPTTPIYNITLANVGVNGYSPIVRFVNETVESFNIAVDNITGTETSPAVPKLSYVADLINNAIAGLSNTYLTRDGSNAANPISLNGIQITNDLNGVYVTNNINNVSVSVSGIATYNSTGATLINASSFDLNANGGEIYVYDDYGIGLNAANNKDIYLDTSGTGKAYYNSSEIATLSNIPTVGNGTITITQGGVTKGTFTTNQSGNSTIQLDGAIIDNPFTVNASTGYSGNAVLYASGAYSGTDAGTRLETIWTDTVENVEHRYTHGLYINNGGRYKEYPSIQYKKEDYIPSTGSGTISSTDLGFINAGVYSTLPTLTAPIYVTRSGAGYIISLEYDNDTLKVNQDGKLYADVQGGSSYTAGTGIDITNDTISVDDTILTTNTVQTVTEAKTFNADIHLNGGDIKLDSTTSYIQGKVSDNVYRNIIARSVASGDMVIGNQGDTLRFAGKLPYPKYNNVDMALLTDIPIVNNATITFTQGGVTKGTITLNQSSNQTIALDAGGSGGGAVDSVNGQTGTVVLTASDVGALPSSTVIPTKTSDLTNDSGFITNSALSGYATETWVGQQGYITGITSSDITTALGYTPYNSSNPNGYITSSALSDYVNKTTDQTVTGVITFSNGIQTYEINNPDGDNLLSNLNNNTSVGDINSTINLYGNTTRPKYYYSQYNTPVDLALSSDIPTVNNPTITFTQGGTTKGTITLNQSSNQTIALDTGGGGGATIDDTTPSTTTVYSSKKTQDLIDTKQNTLTAGDNIQINGDTISATNTTYSAMTVSEGTTGTATTARTMRADRLKSIIQGTKLTGLDTNYYTPITATDNILGALGKLQVGVDDANSMYYYKADEFVPDSPLVESWDNLGIDFVESVGEIDSASILSSSTNDGWCNGELPEMQSTNLINDYWEWSGMFRSANISSEVEIIAIDGVNDGGFIFYIQPNGNITNPDDNNKVLANVYFNDWVRFTIIHQAGDTDITVTLDTTNGKVTTTTALATTASQFINNVGWRLSVSPKIDYLVGTECYFRKEAGGTKYFFTKRHIGIDDKVIDGQWVNLNSGNIISGSNITWTSGHNYDLSSYLPNDGHIYEVIFQASWTGSTTGFNHTLRASTDIITSAWNWLGRAFGTDVAAGTCILPVGTGRYVKLTTEAKGCNAVYFSALGYRRLGTNS